MFGDGPELTVLLYLGLFDRPATLEALAALRAKPPLLGGIDARSWQHALHRLRQVGLVARDAGSEEQLDAHPLVRAHFGPRLKEHSPEAWIEGHRRLYEHNRSAAPDLPNTLAQMEPLFEAVVHGVAAGRHQEVRDQIVWRRILRRDEVFLIRKLGAFSAYLDCLAPLFTEPWLRPADTLQPQAQAWLLAEVGFALRSLGRPRDAIKPIEAALNRAVNESEWGNAARGAGNLSELHLVLGDLARAGARAREAVEHADKSRDKFLETVARTWVAAVLHQRGDLDTAEALFEEAESRQRALQPLYPLLYSLRGYLYCDLLLERAGATAAARHATQTLEWATPRKVRCSLSHSTT